MRIQDGKPRVKVIDFGIAKALGADLTDQDVHTLIDQVIGTAAYMSPEQTDPDSKDVDTRADIYSLGIVLYELLTGTKPYYFGNVNPWAVMAALRETETIPPSARFTRSGTQETAAHNRSTSVSTLRRELVGDLDWIVLKAIDKNRTRRCQSVGELAEDLERYLNNEPVSARPPSVAYKARKFVKRHRAGVAAATVAVVAVASGGTAAAFGWVDAAHNALIATSRELAAAAIVQMQSDPELGVLLALRSAATAPTLQAEDALDHALDSRMLRTYHAAAPIVTSALSRDGRRIAVILRDGSISIRSTDDGTESLRIDQGKSLALAFSPDSRRLVGAGRDGTARIWNSVSGELVAEIAAHDGPIFAASFDPTGTLLATAGVDRRVRLWDAASSRKRWSFRSAAADETVQALAFDPSGHRLAVGGRGMEMDILDVSSGASLVHIPPPPGIIVRVPNGVFSILALAFAPDGRRVMSAGTDGLHLWDAGTGKAVASFGGPREVLEDVDYSPDGRSVVVAGGSTRVVEVLDATTGFEWLRLPGHTDVIWKADYVPAGNRIVASSMDGTVRVWDAGPGAAETSFGGHTGAIFDVTYSRDGRLFATASLDGTATVYDASTLEQRATLRHGSPITHVRFSPDGRRAVTSGGDSLAIVWDTESGTEIRSLKGPSPRITSASFDPSGRRIVTSGDTNVVWDAETGEALLTLDGARQSRQAVFADGGSRVVALGPSATQATVFDARTGKRLGTLEASGGTVHALAASSVGSWVAVASTDATARVWDVRTLKEVEVLEGHTYRLESVAFSADGRRVVTGSQNGTAKVWDATTGAEIRTLDGLRSNVLGVAFRPDGRQIAATSPGRVYIFPEGLDALVQAVAPRAHRALTTAECVRFLHTKQCP